jgi:hypothetical protein
LRTLDLLYLIALLLVERTECIGYLPHSIRIGHWIQEPCHPRLLLARQLGPTDSGAP